MQETIIATALGLLLATFATRFIDFTKTFLKDWWELGKLRSQWAYKARARIIASRLGMNGRSWLWTKLASIGLFFTVWFSRKSFYGLEEG